MSLIRDAWGFACEVATYKEFWVAVVAIFVVVEIIAFGVMEIAVYLSTGGWGL